MIISPGENKWENLIKYKQFEKKNEWMNKKQQNITLW